MLSEIGPFQSHPSDASDGELSPAKKEFAERLYFLPTANLETECAKNWILQNKLNKFIAQTLNPEKIAKLKFHSENAEALRH